MNDATKLNVTVVDRYVEDKWETVECRQYDPDTWFIDDKHPLDETDIALLTLALTVCNRCPLRLECLALGLKDEDMPFGIWGGTLPGERYLMTGNTHFQHHQRAIRKARLIRGLTDTRQVKDK